VLALLVLVTWAAVVALHVRREYYKPEVTRLREGARLLAPGAYFYAIRMGGHTIGVASSRLDTIPGGFVFDDLAQLDIPAMDTVQRAVVRTRARLGSALQLESFEFTLDSELGRYSVRGEARPDSLLELRIGAGGQEERSVVPLSADVILPVALPLRLAAGGDLQVGRTLRVRLFDPSTLAPRTVEIHVAGRETLLVADSAELDPRTGRWTPVTTDTVLAWRIEERLGGVRITSWIDGEGRLVKSESPLGFTVERTSFELSQWEWQRSRADRGTRSGYGLIIESTAIASRADLRATHAAEQLAFRLRGVELEGFDLDGGRQTLRGDTLVVRRETAYRDAGYELPYRGGGEPAGELASTPLIQASDPALVRRAEQIAGGSRDAAEVARRLNGWVYRELRKEITPSVPSAIQVLEARRGDCNEHTVLYVALARALGLPARTAVGVVHLRGNFYYHAWPEVWLGEWVAVDPTLGQFPADAAHLRFLVGGLARQIELIRLVGRLDIEVL
jgi:hypothetical protein